MEKDVETLAEEDKQLDAELELYRKEFESLNSLKGECIVYQMQPQRVNHITRWKLGFRLSKSITGSRSRQLTAWSRSNTRQGQSSKCTSDSMKMSRMLRITESRGTVQVFALLPLAPCRMRRQPFED